MAGYVGIWTELGVPVGEVWSEQSGGRHGAAAWPLELLDSVGGSQRESNLSGEALSAAYQESCKQMLCSSISPFRGTYWLL